MARPRVMCVFVRTDFDNKWKQGVVRFVDHCTVEEGYCLA